jgi:hypothetical protein
MGWDERDYEPGVTITPNYGQADLAELLRAQRVGRGWADVPEFDEARYRARLHVADDVRVIGIVSTAEYGHPPYRFHVLCRPMGVLCGGIDRASMFGSGLIELRTRGSFDLVDDLDETAADMCPTCNAPTAL